MAIADMFLKVQGVTGESGDADHKGEIEVVSWSWGVQASEVQHAITEVELGRAAVSELEVVKRADLASPALVQFLLSNRLVGQVKLTVRKAGKTPVEFYAIEMQKVRITSVKVESLGTDLVERVRLAFARVRLTYTPQDAKGGPGAATQIEWSLEG